MEKDSKSQELVLPELTDTVMQKLHETARNIYAFLKRENALDISSEDDMIDSSIVLAIFLCL
jgi:hypothetical protein